MISDNCSIDEFVESVKGKETWEVITLAIEEATRADRLFYHSYHCNDSSIECGREYSHSLKRLINYLRFEVKPRRPKDKAYCLYVAHWGHMDDECPAQLSGEHAPTVH